MTTGSQTIPQGGQLQPQLFRGQQPGERVILMTRANIWSLTLPAWPVIVGIGLLIGLLWGQLHLGGSRETWNVSQSIVGILTLLLFGRWVIFDAYSWWARTYIVTDRRVIMSFQGFTQEVRQALHTNIQQARIEKASLIEYLLKFGDVTVTVAGGTPIVFKSVSKPRQMVNLITQTRTHYAAPVATSEVEDPELRQVIANLAQPEVLPRLNTPESLNSIDWPLRRATNVELLPDEQILAVINRHWWVLFVAEIPPFLGLCGAGVLTIFAALTGLPILPLVIAAWLFCTAWVALAYLNFVDDVFVLTTNRIVDVDRRYFILFQESSAIEYGKIQQVETRLPTIWANYLGFGDIIVNVAGNQNKVEITSVPHPKRISKVIDTFNETIKQRDEINATNRKKEDLKSWFTAVMTEMIVPAPDLRGLTLEQAMNRAQAEGLRLMVISDSVVMAGIPAGTVVSQSPFPGSRALRGGDISVTLSRM